MEPVKAGIAIGITRLQLCIGHLGLATPSIVSTPLRKCWFVATARNPVMMYSIGKDSSVMLHLARKAFYPAPPPFPLLHVGTGWKFKASLRKVG